MYILFDIGGTNTRVARSTDLEEIEDIRKFDTPRSFTEGVEKIGIAARELSGGGAIITAAGGIRGPLSSSKDSIIRNSVLTDWVDKPLREELSRAFGGAETTLMNDAAAAALGEAHFGTGKGYGIVAYHTVSTGVGGARVVEGKLDESHAGFEPGKQVIDVDTTLFGGKGGAMLEDLVSGTALSALRGVKPYEVPQSDPIWNELARILAHGLRNTIAYWSPDVIVLGGSMILGDPRILLKDIQTHLTTITGDAGLPCPPLVDAAFRDESGLYGALWALKSPKSGQKGE